MDQKKREELHPIAQEILNRVGIPRTSQDIEALLNAFEMELRNKGYEAEANKIKAYRCRK